MKATVVAMFALLTASLGADLTPVKPSRVIQSKATDKGATRLISSFVAVPPPRTLTLGLYWDTSPSATGYRLYRGTNSGVYPWAWDSATNNIVITFTRDRASFFNVKATNSTGSSGFGIEVRYPPFPTPAKAVEIYWPTNCPVTVLASTNLFTWSVFTNVTGTNCIAAVTRGWQFFRVLAPTELVLKTRAL